MDIRRYIDHTLLKPDTKLNDIARICHEAIENNFYSVCISPYFVQKASQVLENSDVKISTVIGFPFGYSPTVAKVASMRRCLDQNVDEFDAVINFSAVKSGDFNFVENDIISMATTAHMKGKIIKVIVEPHLLTKEELQRVIDICVKAEVDFIKNSTGVLGSGAQESLIKELRLLIPDDISIKASGGIKTHQQALNLIEAGADRIGSSSSLSLIQ